jgi:2-polyprenyl-3-methyl-5-hydroxy-6-metoxy-1,4-benzoquinol methylase
LNTTLIPKSPEWFENWFDSEYYHLLYDNRNHEEADLFVSNLLAFLKLPKGAKVMDLACGKGRHSYFLNASGLDVLGVDLSSNSISEAKEMENESLHF